MNKFRLICNITLIVGISILYKSCSQIDSKVSFKTSIAKAIKLEEEGRFLEALNEIDKAIKLDSTQSTPFVIRGRIKSTLKKDSFAILDFSKAILLNSKNTSAFFNKGVSYYILKNPDSALKYFNSAIATKQSGDFNIEINNTNLPVEDQIDIPLEIIRFYRGVSYYNKKTDSLALEDFYYSSSHGYKKAESQLYIGVLLIDNGKIKEGCFYLKQAQINGEIKANKYLKEYCEKLY